MPSHLRGSEPALSGFELPTRATVQRHRTTLGAIVVLAPFAACVQGLMSAPTFVSRASVLVKLGREFQAPAAGGRTTSMYRLNSPPSKRRSRISTVRCRCSAPTSSLCASSTAVSHKPRRSTPRR